MGGLGDHPGKPGASGSDQRVRVGPALQDGQVGRSELAGQRATGQQLADQILDAPLVAGGGPGEPVAGPHPAVQRRPLGIGQPKGVQPGGVDQRQPGQGVGVDAVGLGMPRQHPTQVMGLGRADPVHGMALAGEEHRDRQPRRPGRLDHHLQAGPWWGAGQRGLLHLAETLHGGDRLAPAHGGAIAGQHPHGVSAGDPQIDPDQPSVLHLLASLAVVACSGRSDGRRCSTATVPSSWRPTTAPTHVLQPAPTSAGRATSLIRGIRGRPRVAISRTRLDAHAPSSEPNSTPPPEPAGMLMQPWDLGVDQAPQSLT